MATLSEETELRILVCDNPVTMFGNPAEKRDLQDESSHLRVSARNKASGADVPVTMRVFNTDEFSINFPPNSGCAFRRGDCGVFSARSATPSDIIFKVDLLDEENQEIGTCHVAGNDMSKPTDKIYIMTGHDGAAFAEITVRTHAIHPWPGLKEFSHLEPQTWWKRTGETKMCGHRGMGRTMGDKFLLVDKEAQGSAAYPENTIAAFKQAHELGLTVVEMDVSVSKDGIPFVFHDFDADLVIEKDGEVVNLTTAHLTQMPYREIEVFRNLKQHTPQTSQPVWTCSFNQTGFPDDCKPCPTLQSCADDPAPRTTMLCPHLKEALQSVNHSLAFHIEVKFPMTYVDGNNESEAVPISREVLVNAVLDMDGNNESEAVSISREDLVNAVLDVVYTYGGDRKIIFSAFDPDVCVMLRLKQHRYPVLLINYGPTEKYASYAGLRCSSAGIALSMALAENLQGLNGHSNDYLTGPWWVHRVRSNDLILWVWGEDNNDPAHQEELKQAGVDYITTDRVIMNQL